jgi:hypothetical protein
MKYRNRSMELKGNERGGGLLSKLFSKEKGKQAL